VITLLNRTDLPAFAQRARARVAERWSNARLVDRHLEIYGDLISRHGSSAHTVSA